LALVLLDFVVAMVSHSVLLLAVIHLFVDTNVDQTVIVAVEEGEVYDQVEDHHAIDLGTEDDLLPVDFAVAWDMLHQLAVGVPCTPGVRVQAFVGTAAIVVVVVVAAAQADLVVEDEEDIPIVVGNQVGLHILEDIESALVEDFHLVAVVGSDIVAAADLPVVVAAADFQRRLLMTFVAIVVLRRIYLLNCMELRLLVRAQRLS
jgi:hypothetical protein